MYQSKITNNRSCYWLLILALPCFSCANYFKPVVANSSTAEKSRDIITANAPTKYFILHQGLNSYAIEKITVDNNAMTLNGTLTDITATHFIYVNASGKEDFTYKKSGKKAAETEVLNEVHIYSQSTLPAGVTQSFSMPLSQIEKIEIIEQDTKRTNTNHILVGVGITAGVGIIAAIIITSAVNSINIGY